MECPSTICLSTKIPASQFTVFPLLLFFQSNHIVCFYNKDSGQSSPKVRGKIAHVFDRPWKTLYFLQLFTAHIPAMLQETVLWKLTLQCKQWYRIFPCEVFSFLALCVIMGSSTSFQYLYRMGDSVSPRYDPWHRKICHLGSTLFSEFSFIYKHCIYKYHIHTDIYTVWEDIYTVWEKVVHFKGQTICRHACVCPNFTKEGLLKTARTKWVNLLAMG